METNTQISYSNTLTQAGLALDQATIYELLIQNGAMPAGKISQKTPLKRGLVYKVLDELIAMGLVLKKDVPGKVALFEPAHPLKLKELAEKKEEQAKNSQLALGGILERLVLDFNAISGKPGVSYYEGVGGIEKVYDLIIAERKPLLIFASHIDRDNQELATLIDKQVKRQHGYGITTKALGGTADISLSVESRDVLNKLGIEMRNLPNMELPSQIIIFGNYVAISALTPTLMTTLINSTAIAQTLTLIFGSLWHIAAEPAPHAGR